ncbi:Nif11-like leader peptide family natural product precursor [Salidesulfovibrio brasiliensis]|uniref:Nif11-like leader peptide family natural product precursor n=1 Tax=Salidesulfovibrio brasiliensis TaxID=221711 RepID=UPI0006D2272D|nr:Nif11-like leader peptide family natural product precursor [Salidesulfovibrio brasiliensis]
MSKTEAVRFMNDMANDPELTIKMNSIEDNDLLRKTIADAGYDFTPEEMGEVINNPESNQIRMTKLSEEELDSVVGAGPISGIWGGCKKIARPIAIAGRRIVHGETKEEAEREVDITLGGGDDLISAGDQIADGADDILRGVKDLFD